MLTEDDYLDFFVRVSRDPSLNPPRIQRAIGGMSLLFIGYSLNDLRGCIKSVVECYIDDGFSQQVLELGGKTLDARIG